MTQTRSQYWRQLDAWTVAWRDKLERMPSPVFMGFVVGGALVFSLFFLSPRLFILLGEPRPGTFEWDRGTAFMAQAADPLVAEIEPALRWRLAPVALAHFLQLRGMAVMLVPWAGLVALFGYLAWLSERRLGDRLDALLLVLLVGTFGCTQAITMSHGINDGWLLLAMLATVFGSARTTRLAAATCGPWIDERYLLALPFGLACRAIFGTSTANPAHRISFAPEIFGILPYVLIRTYVTLQGDPTSTGFFVSQLVKYPTYLPYAPLGWWMGARAGWVLVFFAWAAAQRSVVPQATTWLVATGAAGFGAVTLLASDLSRSTNFFLPLLCAGAFALSHSAGPERTRWLLTLLGLNILLPFTMVTYTWIVPILPLPVELLRLLRHW